MPGNDDQILRQNVYELEELLHVSWAKIIRLTEIKVHSEKLLNAHVRGDQEELEQLFDTLSNALSNYY